jgi:TrmH family RNA methyltransferase
VSNPTSVKLLTLARDLKRRKARERTGQFVAEGVRTVEALADSALAMRGVLVAEGADADERVRTLLERLHHRGIPLLRVSAADFASAADTESPQGILAVAEIPRREPGDLASPRRVLLLDAVQDPGNVGTILRTAAALAVDVTIALPGTVDVWNAKVVRSAMGAVFTHPVVPMAFDEAARWLRAHEVPLWAADAAGTPVSAVAAARPARVALVVANEGAGVSPAVAAAAAHLVAIPMAPGAESLNVAVAAGILLYVLAPDLP